MSARYNAALFLPSQGRVNDNYCNPVAYAGISAAMKVAVMHLWTINCRRILYSTLQGKSVSYSIENTVVPEVSQDLVVIFKIKQSTVRNNLPSDIM